MHLGGGYSGTVKQGDLATQRGSGGGGHAFLAQRCWLGLVGGGP